MAALRRRNIVEMLLKLTGAWHRPSSLTAGPGCTCESCVRAWDRHHPNRRSGRDPRRHLRLGLY